MKHLRHVAILAAGLAGTSIAAAVTAAGCSSNGSTAQQDSGSDVTSDAHPDVQQNDVQAQDVQSQDVKASDVLDAGAPDGDAQDPISAFQVQLATTFCAKAQACCTSLMPAGTTWDTAKCINVNVGVGYQASLLGVGPVLGSDASAELHYDPAKAQACLADLNAIDCSANVVTTAQQKQLYADCFAAVTGSLASGATCTQAVECGAGLFCDTAGDGGPAIGTCQPLRADGGPCGDFGDIPLGTPLHYDYTKGEEACSYRRTGTSGLRCDNADPTTGADYDGGPAVWVCRPQFPEGGSCNLKQDCQSLLCDPGTPGYEYDPPDGGPVSPGGTVFQCSNSMPFEYKNDCLPFAK
jgi:hypothetical protein